MALAQDDQVWRRSWVLGIEWSEYAGRGSTQTCGGQGCEVALCACVTW